MKQKNNAWADTNKEWAEEVAAVLASEGLPWRASSCWCEQRTSTRCAEVTHMGSGNSRQLTIAGDHLATPASRRAEIVRQLKEPPSGGSRKFGAGT